MSFRTGGSIVFVVGLLAAIFGHVVAENLIRLPDLAPGQPSPPLVAVGLFRIMATWFVITGAIIFALNDNP